MKKLIDEINELVGLLTRLLPLFSFLNTEVRNIIESNTYNHLLSGVLTIQKSLNSLPSVNLTDHELKSILTEASKLPSVKKVILEVELDEIEKYLNTFITTVKEIKAS